MSKELGDVEPVMAPSDAYWDSDEKSECPILSPRAEFESYTLGSSLSQDQLLGLLISLQTGDMLFQEPISSGLFFLLVMSCYLRRIFISLLSVLFCCGDGSGQLSNLSLWVHLLVAFFQDETDERVWK